MWVCVGVGVCVCVCVCVGFVDHARTSTHYFFFTFLLLTSLSTVALFVGVRTPTHSLFTVQALVCCEQQ